MTYRLFLQDPISVLRARLLTNLHGAKKEQKDATHFDLTLYFALVDATLSYSVRTRDVRRRQGCGLATINPSCLFLYEMLLQPSIPVLFGLSIVI